MMNLDITSNVWSKKEKIDKLDSIKILKFCSIKGTVKRMKIKTPIRRKYLQITYHIKDFYVKYPKNS